MSGAEVPGGLSWGLHNRSASPPSGWRDELLDFKKYEGPGIKYAGQGKLPPMVKDVIVHYFYLLGLNPNDGEMIPEDYVDRNLEDFHFIPPPSSFVIPDWATPYEGDDESCFVDTRHMPNDVPHDDILHYVPVVPNEVSHDVPFVVPDEVPNEVPNDVHDVVPSDVPQDVPERIILRIRVPAPKSPPRRRCHELPPPPPPPSKRQRSSSQQESPAAAPQASSTMRSEYDLQEKSPIVLRLHKQRVHSKPSKKQARLSTTLGNMCAYCSEPVTELDMKSKNGLVNCSNHKVHKYCQQDCIAGHSDYF